MPSITLTSDIICMFYEGTKWDVRSSNIPDLYCIIQKVGTTKQEKPAHRHIGMCIIIYVTTYQLLYKT